VQKDACRLERSRIKHRECLSPLEKDWLVGCLVSRYGMQRAIYSDEDPRQLMVEYDADRLNCDLIDVFYVCGLDAESIPTTDIRPGPEPLSLSS
jgi:hypothetical protein